MEAHNDEIHNLSFIGFICEILIVQMWIEVYVF
jgi:hypothetical protein